MNYSRAPEMILPGRVKCFLGMFRAAVKPEHQSGYSRLRCNAMRWYHRIIIASDAGYPGWYGRVGCRSLMPRFHNGRKANHYRKEVSQVESDTCHKLSKERSWESKDQVPDELFEC
jgi:hypothetical protein